MIDSIKQMSIKALAAMVQRMISSTGSGHTSASHTGTGYVPHDIIVQEIVKVCDPFVTVASTYICVGCLANDINEDDFNQHMNVDAIKWLIEEHWELFSNQINRK